MKAAIVSVNVDGKTSSPRHSASTMPGVPATTDMYFRNGAVAFQYMSNLLLQFVDEGKVHLDDTIDRWMPELPRRRQGHAADAGEPDRGLPRLRTGPGVDRGLLRGPVPQLDVRGAAQVRGGRAAAVRARRELELLALQLHDPRRGPVEDRQATARHAAAGKVLEPLASSTPSRPRPPTSRRRSCTRSAPSAAATSSVPRTSRSTRRRRFWNTQWGTPIGANEITKIDDMIKTASPSATGKLLSKASYQAMTDPDLIGFGNAEPGVRAGVLPADRRLQLRARRRPVRDRGSSRTRRSPARLGRGLPAVEEDRDRRRQHVRPGLLRGPGPEPAVEPVERLFQKIGAYLAPNDAPPGAPRSPLASDPSKHDEVDRRPPGRPDPAADQWVAGGIVPFLVAGFVLLYLLPGRTGELFAWPIAPTMTAMLLGSAYAGGVWFFVGVLRARRWTTVGSGFPPVVVVAVVLAGATVADWDQFSHDHVAFWVWTALHVLVPLTVAAAWLANRRTATPAAPGRAPAGRLDATGLRRGRRRLGVAGRRARPGARSGVLRLAVGDHVAHGPGRGRVLGLGVAAFTVLRDDRRGTVVRLLEAAVVMATFAALAVVRAHDQIAWSRSLAWVMVAGLAVILGGGALLLARSGRGADPRVGSADAFAAGPRPHRRGHDAGTDQGARWRARLRTLLKERANGTDLWAARMTRWT